MLRPRGVDDAHRERAISHREPAAIRTDRHDAVPGDSMELLACCRLEDDGRAESAGVQSRAVRRELHCSELPAGPRIETADIQIQEHRLSRAGSPEGDAPRRLESRRRGERCELGSIARVLDVCRRPAEALVGLRARAAGVADRERRYPAEVAAGLGAGVGCLTERDRPRDGVDRRRSHFLEERPVLRELRSVVEIEEARAIFDSIEFVKPDE